MTVSNTNNKVVFVGDGATLIFAYTFRIFQDSDLNVTIQDTSVTPQTEIILVLNTDYTVSGAGSPSGGDVTLLLTGQLSAAPSATDNITILRDIPITQPLDLALQGSFPSQANEDAFDRRTFVEQQLQEQLGRTINIPANITGVSTDLPAPVADFILGWDAAATSIINIDPATIAASTIAFLNLPDTPSSYAGSALLGVRVNAGANALEFASIATNIEVQDEGTPLTTAVTKFNFVGTGVTVTEPVADEMLVTIPGVTGVNFTLDVNQTTHGFSVGNWLYNNGTIYALADASVASTSDVIGVITAVADVDNFTIQFGGRVTGLSGLTKGAPHFLSESAGAITATKSTVNGVILRVVLIADSITTGFIFNMREKSVFIGTFTRDLSLGDGTVGITGIGFRPQSVDFIAMDDASSFISFGFGFSNASTDHSFFKTGSGAGSFNVTNRSFGIDRITTAYFGGITTMDADGFTIDFDQQAAQTGTMRIIFRANQ